MDGAFRQGASASKNPEGAWNTAWGAVNMPVWAEVHEGKQESLTSQMGAALLKAWGGHGFWSRKKVKLSYPARPFPLRCNLSLSPLLQRSCTTSILSSKAKRLPKDGQEAARASPVPHSAVLQSLLVHVSSRKRAFHSETPPGHQLLTTQTAGPTSTEGAASPSARNQNPMGYGR